MNFVPRLTGVPGASSSLQHWPADGEVWATAAAPVSVSVSVCEREESRPTGRSGLFSESLHYTFYVVFSWYVFFFLITVENDRIKMFYILKNSYIQVLTSIKKKVKI